MIKAYHEASNVEAQPKNSDRRTLIRAILICTIVVALVCSLAYYQTKKDQRLNVQYLQPGLAFYRHNDYADAEKCFRAYLRGGTDTEAHYYLGMCLYNEGRRSDALQEFLQDTYDDSGRHSRYTHLNSRSEIMIERITGKQLLP